jgi:hypothetical protein
MRPIKDSIINGGYGDNFQQLFTSGGVIAGRRDWNVGKYGTRLSSSETAYVFGVIRERDSNTLVLVNRKGLDSEAYYLDLSDNVIVYTCDVSDKNAVTVGGASDIMRSVIISGDKDDDDNIVSWREDGEYNYALARVVGGEVIEMVMYTGYGD